MDLPVPTNHQILNQTEDTSWTRSDYLSATGVGVSILGIGFVGTILSKLGVAMNEYSWVYTLMGGALVLIAWWMGRSADARVRQADKERSAWEQWKRDVQTKVDSEEAKLLAVISEEKRVTLQQAETIIALREACAAKDDAYNSVRALLMEHKTGK